MEGGGTLIYALHRPDLFSAAPLSLQCSRINKFIEWIFRNNYNYNYDFDFIQEIKCSLLKANHPSELIEDIPIKIL